VDHDAAAEVYRVYRGDLRGTLRALDEATQELIGYTGRPGAPINANELFGVLVPMLQAEADSTLGETLQDRFYALRDLGGEITQKDLMDVWDVTQAPVSASVRELQRLGYVHETRREGRRIWYALTGPARLVLGLDHPTG
jgi:predicted transcriptional regulator